MGIDFDKHPDLLDYYFDLAFTPEQAEILKQATTLLDGIGYTEYRYPLEGYIADMENVDPDETRSRIIDTLRYTYTDLLAPSGIYLVSGFDLQKAMNILDLTYQIDKRDDSQALIELIDDDGTPEERFCSLIVHVHGGELEDYLAWVDWIDPNALDRVRMRLQRNVENEDLPDEQDKTDDFGPFHEFIERYNPKRMIERIRNEYRLGFRFEVYFDELVDVDEDNIETIAKEYMAAALASGESPREAEQKASERLEFYFDDMRELQKVIDRVRSFSEDISNA